MAAYLIWKYLVPIMNQSTKNPPSQNPEGKMAMDLSGKANPAGGKDYRITALIIASALFIEHMDGPVLATALPTLAQEFQVSVIRVSGAMTSYLAALAVFIPASGQLADRFGSKSIFMLAIVLFMSGSMLAGAADSLGWLMGARFLQGIGGAMMIPVGNLIVLRSVTKKQRLHALTWLLIPSLIGPIVGPPIGGLFVDYWSWRWIFYMNMPLGVLGLWLVAKYIPQVKAAHRVTFDVRGLLLSGIALGCLLFGFEMFSDHAHWAFATILVSTGLLMGSLYIAYARRSSSAILDLSLLQIPTFRLAVMAGAMTRIATGALPFILPLVFQLGFGMSAAASGAVVVASTAGHLGMKWLAPPVLRRFGYRQTLVFNGLISSIGFVACAFFRPGWPISLMVAVLIVHSVFLSVQFAAYNTLAYDDIPPEKMSSATSFYSTFQQFFLSLGICVGAISLQVGVLLVPSTSPGFPEFTYTFLALAVFALLAIVWTSQLQDGAGDELAGRKFDVQELGAK